MTALTVTGTCPRCHHRLTLRTAQRTQNLFVGCEAYPHCRFTSPFVPELLRQSDTGRLHQEITHLRLALGEAYARLALAERRQHQPHPADMIPRATMDRALRRLAAICHPDRWHNAPPAEEATKEILALRARVMEGQL